MPNAHDEEPDDTPLGEDRPLGEDDTGGDANSSAAPPRQTLSGVLAWVPAAVGVLALLGYAAFVLLLLDQVKGADDRHWLRSLHLFASVEAIAFAAAGFFFGREVNRARAEHAEDRAQRETRRAERAVTRGRELARDLSEVSDVERAPGGVREGLPSPSARLALLARKAERWFPPPA